MELQKNGFSDRFFEMAEQGKSLYTGSSNEFSYYKNIALYGADGYILKEKYDKAFEFINSLDLNEVKHSDSVLRDNGLCIVSYFDIQMELCNEYGDKERANNVFRDAKPYLDKFYGANNVSMVIDEFYFSYYYLNQDYMLAIEHAEAMINNPFHKMNSIIAGYLNLAMAYNKMGDTARALEILDEAVKIMNNKKNPVSIQSYEYAKKQIEIW
ncbi:MAG: hypothetical protein K6B68_14130 [Eubacterium sp.]|nr:hypothetical protein [Eubacterium sp.]